jgi:uncharacterized protein YutE (UPF0331/DUF86 family)
MDEIRNLRYHHKIHYIKEGLPFLNLLPNNELEKRGLFYTIQTIIEALIDLIAMLVKDFGIEIKDDASNIDSLTELKQIEPEWAIQLKQANSMRNIIVHRYNGIEEQKISESIDEIKTIIENWIPLIEVCVNELSSNDENQT